MSSANNTEDLIAGRSGLNGISMSTDVVDEAGLQLTVPANAKYALLVLEAYDLSDADQPLCCRWADTQDAINDVDDDSGLPLGHLGMIELKGKHSLNNFAIKMISTVTSGYPKLKILYYE